MGEATIAQHALSRRTFLKTAGAAGALAAAGSMTGCSDWLSTAQVEAGKDERIGYTFHQNHCGGHCSLKCTVRDGRLVLVEPNDAMDKPYRISCMRAVSEVQHVYSDERIQTPLKRVGERGEGKFEAISWDEAIDIIKENVQDIWSKYGRDALVVAGTSDVKVRYPHIQKLFNAQNDGRTGIDLGLGNGFGPMYGQASNYTMASADSRDWVYAKTLILVSTNFLETSISNAKTFFDAKEAGTDITVIDTQFTTTAGKATRWIPIEPGTDGALFLGMITHILDNGWVDEEFMRTKTTFPALINPATGAMLRQDMETATAKQSAKDNPYLVWDPETETAVPYTETDNAALEGEYQIDGVTYIPVFEALKRSQAEHGYTTAWASKKTGIPQDAIEDLAYRYACVKPATLSFGWGGSNNYLNSDICGHAMGIIAAITGNRDKPGASVGVHIGPCWIGKSASLAAWPLPTDAKAATQEMASYRMRTESTKVKGYICEGDMFQQHYANMNVTREWLKSLDFVAVIDMYHVDSYLYADVVLPACTKFETTEELESLKSTYGYVVGQGHVIDPLFEAKPDLEIERLIVTALGYGDAVPKTSFEFCKYQIEHSTDARLQGLTIEAFMKNQNCFKLSDCDEINRNFAAQVSNTLSGRIDPYNESFVPYDQALPVYEDPDEVYEGNPLKDKYPLQFASGRTKYHIHSMFCDSQWIREFYDPWLDMNPADMESRGLEDGDTVEVYNDRGRIKTTVRANNAIRPGSPRMYEGNWSKYLLEGNAQDLTNDKLSSREDILSMGTSIPWQDVLVEVKKA